MLYIVANSETGAYGQVFDTREAAEKAVEKAESELGGKFEVVKSESF